MTDFPPTSVLVLARDAQTARRWADWLRQPGWHVATAADDLPADRPLDILVTDADATPAAPASDRDESIGVVRIGAGGTADVHLTDDFTARELLLACRLLAEIVRLRRRQQTGSRLTERLAREALTDPLTGLANRRAWDVAMARRLAAFGLRGRAPSGADSGEEEPAVRSLPPTARTEPCLCVAILDLDHFKRINDAHGHTAGDEVLRATGRALCEGLRQDDFVARLGGDEFGLLLWVRGAAAAGAVVDRVRRALPGALGSPHRVTASAGYHVLAPLPSAKERPRHGASDAGPRRETSPAVPRADELFAAADAALRAAKEQGRDQTVGSGSHAAGEL